MRRRIVGNPYAQWLAQGLCVGVAVAILHGVLDGLWAEAAMEGAAYGAMFGLVMSALDHWVNRGMRPEMRDMPPADLEIVLRAAARGPAPEDPRLREAARDLAKCQLEEVLRGRRSALAAFSVALVATVALTFSDPWAWLPAGIVLLGLTLALTAPARLKRRLRALE